MAYARTHSSQRTVRIIFAGLVMVLITACGGGGGGSTPPPQPPPAAAALTTLSVAPASVTLAPGATRQLTATGAYSDGTSRDISAAVTWTSSTPAIATVSNTGLVAGMTVGSATIVASSGSITGQASVSVTSSSVTLTSISLTPTSSTLNIGQTVDITATGNFSNGTSTTPYDNQVTWSSANNAVATVNAGGVVTAIAAGTTTIRASGAGGVIGTATVTVNATSVTLTSISLTPSASTLSVGGTVDFTATGNFSNGTSTSPYDSSVTWSSANSAVATVATNGSGLVTAVTAGTTTIRASGAGGVFGTATVTVNAPSSTTVTLWATIDNLVMYSSVTTATQTTAYPTGELAVGCNWTYNSFQGIQNVLIAKSLVKFNVASLAGKTIDSATLKLTTQYTGSGGYPRIWYIGTLASTSSWGGAITWNGASSFTHYTASEQSFYAPTTGAQVYNIGLASTVQNWANGSWVNNGLILETTNYTSPGTLVTSWDIFGFYGSETSWGPALTVTYH